jgi:hypothetical protein
MDERVELLGIRHHGPGSAASLVAALDALQPQAVLIEGPADADALLPYAAAEGMQPPLALLAYEAEKPRNSVFYPFAVFSPEWQAMRWALRHGRPVRFIDWPASLSLAWRPPAASKPEEVPAEPPLAPAGDPLSLLAEASGHEDGEALWDALVESRGAAVEVFAAIEVAMTALRAERESIEPWHGAAQREALREAHMRGEIRKALKEYPGKIAVVVGAWHVPALRAKVPALEDRATLKDAAKVKTEISWVPWTETRLAAASGYGAGVQSPGWYGHLWQLYEAGPLLSAPDRFAATWQAKVATLLRAEGHPAATASVIEAARLALSLAAMRDRPAPGLAEMRDATLAALCHGDAAPYKVIETRLVVGQAVGVVDASVPQMPLAADLAAWQRRLRLKPEELAQDISLDLRSEAGFAKSVLLHRLDLLAVPWGRLVDAGAGRGTFREIWRLAWAPELSVRLAEALIHGVTIEQAAGAAAVARMTETESIGVLSETVRRCLLSDLPEAAERCIALLQQAAVNAVDIVALMRAVPSLVSVLRYGTARKMPLEALSALAKALAVEVNAGIGLACGGLDDAAAEQMRGAMAEFDAALLLLDDAHLTAEWHVRLGDLVDNPSVVPPVAGLALRRLYDRSVQGADAVARAFARALSPTQPPKAAGQWLQGFLGGNAEVILQDEVLFGLIDAWLGEQEEAGFVEILPMLRRAFGSFGAIERRRLLGQVEKGPAAAGSLDRRPATAESPGFTQAVPLLLTILGLDQEAAP